MKVSTTYYILDAQGNQLSMYEHRIDTNSAKYYLAERNIYGSSRLGTTNDTINMFMPEILPSYGILGNRTYELSNHLGNVLTTISDIKYPISSDNTTIDGYEVGINGISDYSPFGAALDGRTVQKDGYRYKFQSQEFDTETGLVNYTFRMHNARLGRFLSIDPLKNKYPWNSSYSFSENNVINAIELEGLEKFYAMDGSFIGAGNPNNKMNMLVLGPSTAKGIKNMSESERVKYLNDKPFDIIVAPNNKMIKKMEEIQNKGYNKEFGFAYAIDENGGYVFSKIYESSDDNTHAIDLGPAIKELEERGFNVLGILHSHPTRYKVTKEKNGFPTEIERHSDVEPTNENGDISNQKIRLNSGIVQQSGLILGNEYKLVADMLADAPAYGTQPNKVATYPKITIYGDDKDKVITIDFKDLKNASKKIEKQSK